MVGRMRSSDKREEKKKQSIWPHWLCHESIFIYIIQIGLGYDWDWDWVGLDPLVTEATGK